MTIEEADIRIRQLDALNTELTDLYNKHMRSWAEREVELEKQMARIQKVLHELKAKEYFKQMFVVLEELSESGLAGKLEELLNDMP